MKDLYIVVNEKIYNNKSFVFCENRDIKSIVNFLAYKYNIFIISRNSNHKKPFRLNKIYKVLNLNLKSFFSFFFFLFSIKKNKKKLLIISITPFNFIIFFIFKIFYQCKFYLYLRSNGYEEYKNILGKKYVWIYDFMFKCMTEFCEIITCHKRLYKKNCHILRPSELSISWYKNINKNNVNKNNINILYVGRFKIEKGIYSLLKLFSQLPNNVKLTLVGSGDLIKTQDKRIKIIDFIKDERKLINIYDKNDIIILPSYTEGHPKVVDESLSRLKPVIIFNEIKYVIDGRKGVFCSKRNSVELKNKIYFIINNYNKIIKDMKKNKLPTKNIFLSNLSKIISNN